MNKISTTGIVKSQILKRLIRKVFILFFIFFSFILIFVTKPDNSIMDKANGLVLDTLSPFIKIVSYPIYFVISFVEDVSNFRNLKMQYNNLKIENSNLKEKLNFYKGIERENNDLKSLLNYANQDNNTFLFSKLVGYSGASVSNSFILNSGLKDGVNKYDGVLVDGYLVGQIASVGKHFSRMISLNDVLSKIPIQIERTKTRAFLVGNNTKYPLVMYFENFEPVKVGDVVITSGMGKGIPYGIPVGIVANISDDKKVTLQPFVNSSNINYVKILKSFNKSSIDQFIDKESNNI